MSEDMEATSALLARMATVKAWVGRPASPPWRPGRTVAAGSAPFRSPLADDAAVAYLRLLDQVLADRVITDAEVHRLRATAQTWGIGALEIENLHRGYIARVWEEALADERVTAAERQDIALLARLLGTPLAPPESVRPRARRRWVAIKVESGTDEGEVPGRSAWSVRPEGRLVESHVKGSRRSARTRSDDPAS